MDFKIQGTHISHLIPYSPFIYVTDITCLQMIEWKWCHFLQTDTTTFQANNPQCSVWRTNWSHQKVAGTAANKCSVL